VESEGAPPAPLVVELAMDWAALGQTQPAGTETQGTKLQ
jgi:hypothetical protein